MTIDYITFCCDKDVNKLHDNVVEHQLSHNFIFNKVHVIHQRTSSLGFDYLRKMYPDKYVSHEIDAKEYPDILLDFQINPINDEADEYTHGWKAPHYWKHHCVNHLKGLQESNADYIVFSDADCFIKLQRPNYSWINEAIKLLRKPDCLVVSPGDGSGNEKTQIMSQQLLTCDRDWETI